MKILCVIDSLGSGGAQRQLVELALSFRERGHHVSFLTYHHISFYNSILEDEGITIKCIQDSNYLKRLLKMRRFIRQGNYDAVLSFLESANFICEVAGLPFRKWALVVGERSSNPNVLNSTQLKMYRFFHFFSDYTVANSYTNMKMVCSINPFLPDTKCKVIYNMVDLSRWAPLTNYIPREDGKLKLVIASSHQRLKNIIGLVEALALLNTSAREKLIVEWYGDILDNSLVEAKKRIKDYKLEELITFFPATHDITRIIQGADVVGLFSFYEGLPNSICEGMACGKPIICSNISDIPSLISHQENYLFDPDQPQSIKNVIIDILHLSDKELMRIGKQNRNIAEKLFNKNNIVKQYLELLGDIIVI